MQGSTLAHRLMIITVTLLTLVTMAAAQAGPAKVLPDGTHRVRLSIPEMECSVCCSNVRLELMRVKGVREVSLDEAHRIAVVRFHPAQTSVPALVAAVKKANLDATPVDEPNRP